MSLSTQVTDFFQKHANHNATYPIEPNACLGPIVQWLELLQQWNQKLNLTAVRSEKELVELTLLDALKVSEHISAHDAQSMVDVGSGFGGPGLAIALLRPSLKVTLVEPLDKRVSFLRAVIGSLHLMNRVEICATRVETLIKNQRHFEIAISRATFAPHDWFSYAEQLAPQGHVIVLLAREDAPMHVQRTISWQVQYQTDHGAPRIARAYAPTTIEHT